MSGINYSKWDNLKDEDDYETALPQVAQKDANVSTHPSLPKASIDTSANSLVPEASMKSVPAKLTKKGKEGRLKFEYEGRTIYEWEQSLQEVNIYIEPPPNLPRNLIEIVIQHRHLIVGVKNTPPFIDEDTWGPVKVAESMWTMTDGEININLQKMNKAEAWHAALCGKNGSEIDPLVKEEVKKKLMLERFQEEHPGFDFSGASFNGEVPSARDFMGGVSSISR